LVERLPAYSPLKKIKVGFMPMGSCQDPLEEFAYDEALISGTKDLFS